MPHDFQRTYGRKFDQLRNVKISYNVFGYASGSVLFELGDTKILCSVTMQSGVPQFLKGSKTGWLTAEYAMLPTAGKMRSSRESVQGKRNERAVEISRFIGRSLRAVVNLSRIGERTIYIDCDVLQADGSTRTASITGAYLALQMAVEQWIENGDIAETIITDSVVGVSTGITKMGPLLDLDYAEDSMIDADYNFVLTQSEKIIEIQGTAEKNHLTWHEFDQLKKLAVKGALDLFSVIRNCKSLVKTHSKTQLFSLKNRFVNAA